MNYEKNIATKESSIKKRKKESKQKYRKKKPGKTKNKNISEIVLQMGDANYTATCPPITKTIQVRQTRHAGHCRRNKDELISDVLLWTLTYGQAKARRPARTYIQQLCEDTGCRPARGDE